MIVNYIIVAIIFVLGIFIGAVVSYLSVSDASNGDLIIMHDESTGEQYMFLELDGKADKLKKARYATFVVKRRNYPAQK